MEQIYAIYRGEKFLDTGTAKELAAKLGVRPKTIHFYTSPTYKRRQAKPKNPTGEALIVIAIGSDEE